MSTSLRELPPVEENVPRPATASQTLLAKLDSCPRSGYLYLKHAGGPSSPALVRGTIFHRFAEEAVNTMLQTGETQMPPDVARELAQAIIEESDEPLPAAEQDAIRLMAFHWAESTAIDPGTVAAVEQLFELELGDWTVRGKIDLALILGETAVVRDYKTSLAIPGREQAERDFQLWFYALLLAEGRIEGKPMPLAAGLNDFYCELVFPRYRDKETTELVSRGVEITRSQLVEFRAAVERILRLLDKSLETGEWPAVPGSHCAYCPAAGECPIPAALREHSQADGSGRPVEVAEITNLAEAEDAALRWHFHDALAKGLNKSLRAFASENGPVYFGDYALDFTYQESRGVKDREALMVAIHKTLAYGEPFDIHEHFPVKQTTRFGRRKQTKEERGE